MITAAFRRDWWLLALNAAAIFIAYVWASYPGMLEPEHRGYTDNGYALLSALRIEAVRPLLATLALLDLLWILVRILRDKNAERSKTINTFVAVCIAWISAHLIVRTFG